MPHCVINPAGSKPCHETLSGKEERDALLRLAVGADDEAALQGIGPCTAVFVHNAERGRLNGVFCGKRGREPAPAPAGAAHTFEARRVPVLWRAGVKCKKSHSSGPKYFGE